MQQSCRLVNNVEYTGILLQEPSPASIYSICLRSALIAYNEKRTKDTDNFVIVYES
jgi:hypothetical protein